jgi:carbon monoxide dehydrogenase subunit G
MKLTDQQILPVGQAQAWEALNDIALLQSAIPGCESLTATGDNQYEALVTGLGGPGEGQVQGQAALDNLQPPTSYTMAFEGQGGAAGHGKGTAEIRLEAKGPRSTVLHYTAHASVGGKLAQVGSRLVDMAAQKMATEFFDSFNHKLQERYHVAPVEEPAAAPAPQGLLARLLAWFKRLFGG